MDVSDLLIRAAGGVLIQVSAAGPCVLMIHRPRYDDWSMPKGKADGDETDEDTARREVEEETGFTCRLVEEIATSHYVDRKGRPKRVRWYRMEPITYKEFQPNDEVDEVRWVPIDEAEGLLSYERERAVLAQISVG